MGAAEVGNRPSRTSQNLFGFGCWVRVVKHLVQDVVMGNYVLRLQKAQKLFAIGHGEFLCVFQVKLRMITASAAIKNRR